MIYGLWNGGTGYASSDLVNDLERFCSIGEAKNSLYERERNGGFFLQFFPYVNRGHVVCATPCVEKDSSLWIWGAADTIDGTVLVPEYPDRIISFGPRGGVRVEGG